jgi:hypothetical protein
MSLSLGKTKLNISFENKEIEEKEAINTSFKEECQKLNKSLKIFQLDSETYKKRFNEEIIDNQ